MIKTFCALSCLVGLSTYPAACKTSSTITVIEEEEEEEEFQFTTSPQIDLALKAITQADNLLVHIRTRRSASEWDIHRLEASLNYLSEDLIKATVWKTEPAHIRLSQSISALEQLLLGPHSGNSLS